MQKFMEKIKQISKENEKIAIFVDMDGTIAVYNEIGRASCRERVYVLV